MRNKGISDFVSLAVDRILNTYNYKIAQEEKIDEEYEEDIEDIEGGGDAEDAEDAEEKKSLGQLQNIILNLIPILPASKSEKNYFKRDLRFIFKYCKDNLLFELQYLEKLIRKANTKEEMKIEVEKFINKMKYNTGFINPMGDHSVFYQSLRSRLK